MRLERGRGGTKLFLQARIAVPVAQLGIPGHDVTITLAQAGSPFFDATIPAALLKANRNGTRFRFHDSSGTLAGGITRLTIGGRKRTAVVLHTRPLGLPAVSAGPFTATLGIGGVELSAPGVLHTTRRGFAHP